MAASNDTSELIARVRESRDRGCEWLLAHVAPDGEPVGARERNGWGRLPWALALCGEHAVGRRVLAWAERSQLAPEGGFAPGPAYGTGRFGAYPLAHFAIGAWLLERYDLALNAMAALRRWQDPHTGGMPIAPPGAAGSQMSDLLSTAQTGQAALMTGQWDMADRIYHWISTLCQQQPVDAGQRFYTFRDGETLLTAPPDATLTWLALTDFTQPRQTYYTPGMAAVFLAGYAQCRPAPEAVPLAAKLLQFNLEGCADQFTDLGSVQACKFGWGAAAMTSVDRNPLWLQQVGRMVDWFIARQAPDGSWAPSIFLAPNPTDIDRLVKTAEHVMEVNALLAALGPQQD